MSKSNLFDHAPDWALWAAVQLNGCVVFSDKSLFLNHVMGCWQPAPGAKFVEREYQVTLTDDWTMSLAYCNVASKNSEANQQSEIDSLKDHCGELIDVLLDALGELQFMKETADPAIYAQSRQDMIDEIWAVVTKAMVTLSNKGDQSDVLKQQPDVKSEVGEPCHAETTTRETWWIALDEDGDRMGDLYESMYEAAEANGATIEDMLYHGYGFQQVSVTIKPVLTVRGKAHGL